MDKIQIKDAIINFVKQAESLVEEKLGDRSQLESQVKNLVKNLESNIQNFMSSNISAKSAANKIPLKVKKLINFTGELPKYESKYASGFDVRAQLTEALTLKPGERSLIPTGLSFEIPEGYEIQARPRSGLAIKKGVGLVNSPGTIDADYRGEVKIILINLGQENLVIENGERIAQLVLCPIIQAEFEETTELGSTDRGAGGFGSTGI